MNDDLISQLSELELKEKHLKRCLDVTYYNSEKRNKFFEEIKEIRKQKDIIKFKIRMRKEKANVENNNSIKSCD